MQPGTCLPVTPSRSRATGRTVTCEQGRIRIPSTRGALFSGPFDFRNPLKTGLSYVDKCVLFLAIVAELPERYHPRDQADAHRIINELWADIEELRRQRTADDRDMVALKERNEEVVSKHNDNIERWRDLVETHNDLVRFTNVTAAARPSNVAVQSAVKAEPVMVTISAPRGLPLEGTTALGVGTSL